MAFLRTLCIAAVQACIGASLANQDACVSPGEPRCSSPGIALLQQHARIGSVGALGDDVANIADDARIKTILFEATSIKMWLPSFFLVFSIVLLLGLFFVAASGYCWHRDKRRGAGCICSGCCGTFLLLLAVTLVILKIYLMQLAGPEPSGPAAQTPVETQLVLETEAPFTAKEINKKGPVQTAYVEGMQTTLDKQSKNPGAVKVTGVHATPSPALLEVGGNASHLGKHRVSLVYTLVEKVKKKGHAREFSPRVSPGDFKDALQKAAKLQKGKKVPQVLKDIANGTLSGASNSAVKVRVDATLRCQAKHQLNEDIRATARILVKRHRKEILPELERFAQRKLSGFPLLLADRCNKPAQKESMRLCFGPEKLWMDYKTKKAVEVPKDEDSVKSFLCNAGCTLGRALSAETAKVLATVNSQLQGLEVDEAMLSKISCTPSLADGQKCDSHCS